jgi:fido (protein-threonine AMPylation protein)
MHRLLFQGSGFDFAGRFRVGQEHVEFGGAHQHRRMGARPSEIPSRIERLGSLFFRGDSGPLTREEFIQHAAWFLGEFFRIHPFSDGNGRVARFMLKIASNASSSVRIGVWGGDSRSRRKYVKALQCAHKAASRLHEAHTSGEHSRVGLVASSFGDPAGLGPLVAFLGGIILDRRGDDVFEEEPLPPSDIESTDSAG